MKIGCFDADGRRHSQLLKAMNSKGGDDLRQDAVMEQVFAVANSLLRNNIETRRRALWIRTYKVIPMTPCVGMLQWCEDTIPLGKYLLGRQGAHARYRPNDISDVQARNRMRAFQESKQEVSRLPPRFVACCLPRHRLFRFIALIVVACVCPRQAHWLLLKKYAHVFALFFIISFWSIFRNRQNGLSVGLRTLAV